MRWTRGRGRVGSDVQKRFILVLVLWQSTPVPFGVFLQKKSPLNPLALFTLQALSCLVEHGDVGKAAQVCPVVAQGRLPPLGNTSNGEIGVGIQGL